MNHKQYLLINTYELLQRQMALSVDLAKEALKELEFLATVNKHTDLLKKGGVLELAIYR